MYLEWPFYANDAKTKDWIYISQMFGENSSRYAQFGWKGHNGIDIAAPLDTPVLAMHDGWISECTSKDTGYGLRVTQEFESDGKIYDITYGHFHSVPFTNIPWRHNDRSIPVRAGDVIGYVDSTGFSTGNHLHISLREWDANTVINQNNGFGGSIDPFPYIIKQSKMARVINDKGTIFLEFGDKEHGFCVGIASNLFFKLLENSNEPILSQPKVTPQKMTLADGYILHNT